MVKTIVARPDADRQGQHRDGGEPGILAQEAQGEAEVVHILFTPRKTPIFGRDSRPLRSPPERLNELENSSGPGNPELSGNSRGSPSIQKLDADDFQSGVLFHGLNPKVNDLVSHGRLRKAVLRTRSWFKSVKPRAVRRLHATVRQVTSTSEMVLSDSNIELVA